MAASAAARSHRLPLPAALREQHVVQRPQPWRVDGPYLLEIVPGRDFVGPQVGVDLCLSVVEGDVMKATNGVMREEGNVIESKAPATAERTDSQVPNQRRRPSEPQS